MINAKSVIYYRRIRDLTQQELADLAGVNVATISAIESGAVDCAGSTAKKLANALAISIDQLFRDPPYPPALAVPFVVK